MYVKRLIIIFILLFNSGWACAQSAYTEHTYRLDSDTARPAASIDEVAWLTGNWVGNAFGQRFEEVWNPASAGTMIGVFKLFNSEAVSFYEILLLDSEEGSLSLKVKHFSADFHSWEEKTDFINFKLVKIEANAIHFSGLSFYRDGPNKIHGYIALTGKDNVVREEYLEYQRR